MFGDDIETRARTVVYDASDPAAVLRDVLAHALPGRRGVARIAAVASILAGGRKFAEMNFRTGCEAADLLAARLGMAQPVRDALGCTFERWNGRGQPNQVRGERIPPPMRIRWPPSRPARASGQGCRPPRLCGHGEPGLCTISGAPRSRTRFGTSPPR
jgi:hypothetical protein